jgi:cysteinyl-tRNA synthetase
MREIHLHDTRSGALQPLAPSDPGRVGIYACGPTVYSRIHIGNARPIVIFSLLKRFLEHEGYGVRLVVNITDVNDKIYTAAANAGLPSERLAREMTDAYLADTDALGLGRPDAEPRASDATVMSAILDHIGDLIRAGHAYESGGDVFFKVRSDPDYGSLSHRHLHDMDQGEGVEGADRKHDPLDFALWKARKQDEDTAWDSPWGPGRPGWHIECSAMAEGLLGVGFDIHGGGSDLLFPHHENEAAQTRCARGQELAKIWMHNGMIQSTGEKMAKSVGNIAPLHETVERYGAPAVVMYLIGGHYRQPLAFSEAALEQARANVNRIREAGRRLASGPSAPELEALRERFFAALARDFNTAEALAVVNEWIREATSGLAEGAGGAGGGSGAGDAGAGDAGAGDAGAGDAHLREMLGVLGLEGLLAPTVQAPAGVRELAQRRERARAERDFAAADRLRDEIAALGWEVRDGPAGPDLLPAAGS